MIGRDVQFGCLKPLALRQPSWQRPVVSGLMGDAEPPAEGPCRENGCQCAAGQTNVAQAQRWTCRWVLALPRLDHGHEVVGLPLWVVFDARWDACQRPILQMSTRITFGVARCCFVRERPCLTDMCAVAVTCRFGYGFLICGCCQPTVHFWVHG